jgi:phosphoribosylamine--glycine ligase
VVLKADGLAGGKGVFVANTPMDVHEAVVQLFERLEAKRVLVEECLEGRELSVLAFTDGERLAVMPPARDYKRLLDGNRGPNTGGMGGYTWPADATPELLDEVQRQILEPTLAGMRALGSPYRGVLYAGLMLTSDGPKVLEFNCRFGDPECQLILPLLQSVLTEACEAVVEGRLRPEDVRWADARTYGVVLAARGYPEGPQIGDPVEGLDDRPDGVHVFHAGTRRESDGTIMTAGGRVITLVGEEREMVYEAAARITFQGKQYRSDIGERMVAGVTS